MLMRLITAAAVLALTTGAATAQIDLNEKLTLTGFIDMSLVNNDNTTEMGLDQIELDFIVDLGEGLSMRADFEGTSPVWSTAFSHNSIDHGHDHGSTTVLEQAFISYDVGEGLSLVMGKYLSVSGWETAEPTGLYQHSTSATLVYGGYQHGVGVSYKTDKYGLFGSVVSSVWDGNDTSFEQPGFETQLTLTPVEQVTAKVAYLYEDFGDYNTGLVNGWVAYFAGSLTLAGEVNLLSNWKLDGRNGLGLLTMANYRLSDKIGITGRFSSLDLDSVEDKGDVIAKEEKTSEFTISPSYSVTDNWSIIAEAKFISNGSSTTQLARESLLSF